MKKNRFYVIFALCFLLLLPALSTGAQAAELDEILRYEITVDVNDDATVRMVYHIDWKVLDSSSEGPLTWVKIGIPNNHYISLTPRSSAVKKIGYLSDGGSYARVDLDRSYYAGEVAEIEFELVQDYMYQVDEYSEGETAYHFTPGWYDDIRVDELTIRWNADKTIGQSPAALTENGYLTWTTQLSKGEKFGVTVTYPNDAFAFDLSKTATYGDDSEDPFDILYIIIGALALLAIPVFIIGGIIAAFAKTANFSDGTKKKITRTRVEYYPTCPGCGAARPEGKNNCDYCGRSFIKSEETIEEKDIPAEEKGLRGKTTDGLYRYHSSPNTYMRVHVTHVPVPRSSYSSSRGGRSHSSCAHSSCACACACACAGGGRAGCSTKDFYNTRLKLRQLALRGKREA